MLHDTEKCQLMRSYMVTEVPVSAFGNEGTFCALPLSSSLKCMTGMFLLVLMALDSLVSWGELLVLGTAM